MGKRLLDEEEYQKNKKKIKKTSVAILVGGILLGGGLITAGIVNQVNISAEYSEENKAALREQIDDEKQVLLAKKAELEAKIEPVEDEIKRLERVPFDGFNEEYYAREDRIEELEESIALDRNSVRIINNAISESSNQCVFNEAENNIYTASYCSLKNQLEEKTDFNGRFNSFKSMPFYMFGAFILIASGMFSAMIYMASKRREILAFKVQQAMPVVKEGAEDLAPTIGKVAKEVTKGVREGMGDRDVEIKISTKRRKK